MQLSTETQLFLLVAALYLFDCTQLLDSNEGLLVRHRTGWQAIQGSDDFRWMGKSIYVLNLLAPHQPTYRLSWTFDAPSTHAQDEGWTHHASTLTSLTPFVHLIGAILFGLLPLALFLELDSRLLLLTIAMLYVSVAMALIAAYQVWPRDAGRLRFAGLAAECVACPPLAVNLLRRLSLRLPVAEAFPDAAQRLLADEAWQRVREVCVDRLRIQIDEEPEGSTKSRDLQTQLHRFESGAVS